MTPRPGTQSGRALAGLLLEIGVRDPEQGLILAIEHEVIERAVAVVEETVDKEVQHYSSECDEYGVNYMELDTEGRYVIADEVVGKVSAALRSLEEGE